MTEIELYYDAFGNKLEIGDQVVFSDQNGRLAKGTITRLTNRNPKPAYQNVIHLTASVYAHNRTKLVHHNCHLNTTNNSVVYYRLMKVDEA